jgi:hypothetical protein
MEGKGADGAEEEEDARERGGAPRRAAAAWARRREGIGHEDERGLDAWCARVFIALAAHEIGDADEEDSWLKQMGLHTPGPIRHARFKEEIGEKSFHHI